MTRLLSDPDELAARRRLAGARHLAGLRPFLADLRASGRAVPDPDPLDGGAAARVLVLLETPGPRIRGSMIVSRDNPSGTGRNLRAMLDGAGLSRADTLIWNVVPWIIHAEAATNRPPSRAELREGVATIPALLACLPRLRAVVLAGRSAAAAEPALAESSPGLAIFRMHHPSPVIQCTDPAIPRGCAAALAAVAALLRVDVPRRAA